MLTFYEFMRNPQTVLNEVSKKVAKSLTDWLAEQDALGYDNIFGDNKYRIVLPYTSPEMLRIKAKLEKHEKGFQVDLDKGVVTQIVQTQQGAKTRTMRLGKAVEMYLDAEDKAAYNRQGGGYSIVVSRHPVDVLRMSDFSHIQSCHSEGGMYWQCAIDEAHGHGPIAYLINTEDLKQIPDLQADEIFEDPERNIDGIQPVLRHRLRKYVQKDDEEIQLAIPDGRTYGVSYSGQDDPLAKSFRTSLGKGIMDKQKELIEELGGRPRMKDFKRIGGSYMDAGITDGGLWNTFFGDNKDRGMADFEGDQNIADQYEAEIQAINKEYEGKFKNPVYGYAEVQADDPEHIYVYVSGGVDVTLPAESFVKSLPGYGEGSSWEERRKVQDAVTKAADEIGLYGVEEVDIEGGRAKNDEIGIRIHIRESDGNDGPDEYRDLMRNLEDWEEKYEQLRSAIYVRLHALGYAEEPYSKGLADRNPTFTNFTLDSEDHITSVTSHPMPIGSIPYNHDLISNPYYNAVLNTKDNRIQQFTTQMQEAWQAEAQRQFDAEDVQPWLPGMGPSQEERAAEREIKFPPPQITLSIDKKSGEQEYRVFMIVQFDFHAPMPQDQAKAMEKHIKYLDSRIHALSTQAYRVFQSLIPPQKPAQPTAPTKPV